jgi:hypothetical protein
MGIYSPKEIRSIEFSAKALSRGLFCWEAVGLPVFGVAQHFELADHYAYRQHKGVRRTEKQKTVSQFSARQKKDQTDKKESLGAHRWFPLGVLPDPLGSLRDYS